MMGCYLEYVSSWTNKILWLWLESSAWGCASACGCLYPSISHTCLRPLKKHSCNFQCYINVAVTIIITQ